MDIENPVVGFFRFLVLKKGDLWRFLRRVCNQATLSLGDTPDISDTSNTSDSETDTPFPPETAVSSFIGSGISWFDKWAHYNRYCNILIAWLVSERSSRDMETCFNGPSLTGEISINFLIRLLSDQSINGDSETLINGHKLTVKGTGRVYFKYHTSIFTYQLIDQ